LAATGTRAAVEEGNLQRQTPGSHETQEEDKDEDEYCGGQHGIRFGSMDDWMFGEAARKRLETELPLSLQDFDMPESKRHAGKGSTSCSALMMHLTGCFAAHEAAIARLNAVIRELKSENAHLKAGEAPDKAASQLSGGSSPTTAGKWSSRTLRQKSAAFLERTAQARDAHLPT
jgi:hypothetical protein